MLERVLLSRAHYRTFTILTDDNLYCISGFLQYLQFGYQKGVLYRLKALGERHDMDITIEGFHSWMWRGLSFLLPFLFLGYLFQAYNSYTLYKLSFHPEATWQIPVLSFLFFSLFIGNFTTTILVVPQKLRIRSRIKERYRLMSLSWAMKIRNQIKVNIISFISFAPIRIKGYICNWFFSTSIMITQ